jgi:hypothetical protein
MKIAKPLLLVTTPIGVLGAIREAYRLAGGLVVLMIALILFVSAAIGMLVLTIRKEQRQARERAASNTATQTERAPL